MNSLNNDENIIIMAKQLWQIIALHQVNLVSMANTYLHIPKMI